MTDSNTLALLHFDEDAVTDATGRIWNSEVGLFPELDTANKKFGNSSAYFNGSSTIGTNYDSVFDFGTGDFTVDFWWKQPTSGSIYVDDVGVFLGGYASGLIGIACYYSGDALLVKMFRSYGQDDVVFSTNIRKIDGLFHHYAIVRSSGVVYLFVDGELLDSKPNNISYSMSSSAILCIGGWGINPHRVCIFGNIDEFRISNIARWTEDFTPPTQSYGTNYAYLSSNSLYTGASLTNLTNNWSGLTNAEKEALVPSFRLEMPSIQDLASISPFRVLTDDTYPINVKVIGQPKPQIIEPTSLINTGAVSTIQSINMTNILTDAVVKFAITTDLSTYKVYDATNSTWKISTNIEEDGMSIAQINALTPDILALLDISNGIAFKQCFIATSENASAELSEISAVVDIDGSWSQSVHGTDYNVAYPNKTTMSVRLLTNGDYIINYPISSNS